jgi:hypothetical protein
MRLLKPSPGELADRQTILKLKMEYGSATADDTTGADTITREDRVVTRTIMRAPSRINIQPFIDEHIQLQDHFEAVWEPRLTPQQGEEYTRLVLELAELNHQIWKLTDQAHILREAPDRMQEQAAARAAEVLFTTIDLNQKRAETVREINELFKIRVQEKIFA